MKQQAKRALVVVRLSRVTDETTSPLRQREACFELCEQRGYEVIGTAEDLDISAGKTSPFDRPQLGDWLTNRRGEFDVLVTFRMDRIVRRLLDLADLIRWCQSNSVSLVSATETFLDLDSAFGDIIALLVAKVAEMELAAISERNRSAAQHNMRQGKYRGGPPPWGYMPEKVDGDWRFVHDDEQVKVINEVVRRVLDGEPLRQVAADLTDRAVLTPRDRVNQLKGREIRGYSWHSAKIREMLTSKSLLGHAVTANGSIRNDDGSPIIRATPILERDVFEQVQVELAGRENRKEPTKRSSSLLLRVLYCGVCGKPAYKLKGGKGRQDRYRCASAQYKSTCGNGMVLVADANEVLTDAVMFELGDKYRRDRVWDAGSDYAAELAEIDDTLADLTDQLGTGAFRKGTRQRERLDARIADLAERQAQLAAQATRPAGWTWVPTTELFKDWWKSQTVEQLNLWLRSMDIQMWWNHQGIQTDMLHLERMAEQWSNPAIG
ncbi:recombinase family protein [Mycobacteroides abscessus]|uniref:recombinase family protein n=1 Tax=Mycobacteroides abscessus TaxID=36809 RepID=UPI0005E4509A|nr:recombinase family protein [Mycobacteroides abscessus]AWG68183.1 recombinase family protein [Mycobacteroides abscessus]MBN7378370.1 recombinase family protein [Mycobacteroides abscessus subsp. massiliense]MBN7383623.1 recombinase family protein [Mycobacteroides abscessus subsp. massiliense]MBN7493481.1 recombinase family protein [Mycobacteroides abscessus subsp. abscessus]MBN7506252.1 recombinase family protein [Mycobacteroides abscessus subsp. massiliense]